MSRILLALLILALAAPAGAASLRRIAVVASSNDGGPGRPQLRYAEADARAFASVLEDLGDLQVGDLVVAPATDRAALQQALAEAGRRAAAARGPDVRVEVLLYYSGHSDEQGLLPSGQSYAYGDLRAALAAIPADVRIAVLDSCASGALTREKGGVRRPAFAVDQAAQVRGHAFLTSSSDDEAAQESDRIGGSFFTHYLVSGLRGAADRSGDGKVTLTEAYQFAYDETLARTVKTRGGPQHAAYDIQLAGTGDLVLTDLRSTASGLELPAPVSGRVFVRDMEDRLLVELRKAAGQGVELGLPAGRYKVTVETDQSVREASLMVPPGGKATLEAASLRTVTREATALRGNDLVDNPFLFSAIPREADASTRVRGLALQFPLGRMGELDGVELALAGSYVDGNVRGLQADVAGSVVNGSADAVQAGAFGFLVRGDLHGIQASGALALVGGNVAGLQTAGGGAFAGGEVEGLQAAPLVRAGSLHGLQTGVVASAGPLQGAQIAVVNQAASIDGLQVAVANVTGDEHGRGAVNGLQLSLVNVAGDVDGLQLGLVNVAHDTSASFGLFSWVDKGRIDLDVGVGALGLPHLELHSGGARGLYGILEGGGRPDRADPLLLVGAGVGHRTSVGPVDLDLGLDAQQLFRNQGAFDNLLTGLKATVAVRVLPALGLYVGGAYQYLFQFGDTWNPEAAYQKVDHYEGVRVVRFPTLMAGLRVVPHGF